MFPARYSGVCLKCLRDVAKGQYITWSRAKGQRGVYHVDCSRPDFVPEQVPEPKDKKTEADYRGKPVTIEAEATDHTQEHREDKMGDQLLSLISDAVIKQVSSKMEHSVLDMVKQALEETEGGVDIEQVKAIVLDTLKETFPTRLQLIERDGKLKDVGLVHYKFPRLLELIRRKRHVYLWGYHGTGKSTGAQKAAEALELPYGYISLTPQTPESRILGYMSATGTYVRTPFRDIYEHGGVFCVDELDNMSQALATTWNGALENGHMAFPDMIVPRHKNFVMVGTGNTNGAGANPSYPERRTFDKAFRDRFTYLEWNYDEKLEKAIAVGYSKEAEKYADWIFKVRKWAIANYPKLVPSPRVTFRLAESIGYGDAAGDVLDEILWQGDTEAKSKVLANCPLP